MNEDEFNDFIKNRYEKQIDWYDKKSSDNKKYYQILQVSLLLFSSLTPVLIAIDFGLSEHAFLKWIAVITAVIVAITSSAIRIFKFHDNWITYRNICETLKKEIYYYQSDINEYAKCDDKKKLFVGRVEDLISKQNNLWQTFFRKEN